MRLDITHNIYRFNWAIRAAATLLRARSSVRNFTIRRNTKEIA